MPQALDERRDYSQARLTDLRTHLTEAARIASGKACVYITGSYGRGEGSAHSDLDLFIVGDGKTEGGKEIPSLSNLDSICLKAELINTVRRMDFPEFSGDGEYLKHYSTQELVKSLGTREDDAKNTFTARLLLLLESQPLIGDEVYQRIINAVIDAYWRDYKGHEGDFLPAFLTNDILRLWRTFCVNYEAHTQPDPEDKKHKRRLKNYKLRHSRLLTCYSALLYLMWVLRRKNTVSPDDARALAALTPTQRIERIAADTDPKTHSALDDVLRKYATFLEQTNASETQLLQRVGDKAQWLTMHNSAPEFPKAIFLAINELGGGGAYHRMLVV